MSNLRLTTVQSDLQWIQPEVNRKSFAEKLAPLQGATDLILLPEMFTTGFFMQAAQQAEPFPGPSVEWMQETAAALQAVVAGSLICEDKGRFFNRLLWVQPDGHYQYYDKRHLFEYAGEGEHYTPGKERLIVRIGDWRICPLICYDLRFPVWSSNAEPYYDVLVYVANWPAPRRTAWVKLLQARAIENQSYVAGVNRVGEDANNNQYLGDTCVIDFMGNPIYEAPESTEELNTVELSMDELKAYRSRFPFLSSADSFQVLRD